MTRLDADTIATIERLQRQVSEHPAPSPDVIEARRQELRRHSQALREGFPAPIIVNGRTVAYAVIHDNKIVSTIDADTYEAMHS